MSDDTLLLRSLNAQFIHNYVTRDVAKHDALLHSAFICISNTGAIIDRASYLQRWATLFDPAVTVYWDTRGEDISIHENLALVRATNRWIDIHNGQEVMGMTFYCDAYLKEDGRWCCLQAQLTDVKPEHWPPDSEIINVYLRGVLQKH
jgi:hypothetical protein